VTPFEEACAHFRRLDRLAHLNSIVRWDQAANMPPQGNEARSQALAELDSLQHEWGTRPILGEWLASAATQALDETDRASLREMQRAWHANTAVPPQLVRDISLATSRCEHAWRSQRPANDWEGYRANLREVVRLAREQAHCLAAGRGLSPYEALMDRYEPGVRCADIDRLFGDLKGWLPALIREVPLRQQARPLIEPQGPFPKAAQRALGAEVMQLLGFDFTAGRLDESTHPFCGGVPQDVRLTSRYDEGDFLAALMATIHETGHGRYEQNLPREWLGLPISHARSMGVHESQSLTFEMQLARHPGFSRCLQPLLVRHLGNQPAFEPANLARLLTRSRRGLIRVYADEVSYPAHVILRYGIERPLIDGDIEVDDIPALWDAGMQELLGLDTRGNYKDGCLQDIHWGAGLFGYFPTYALGAMYAAQWFATLRRESPDLDDRIAAGDFSVVFDWLKARIWSQASRWETPELVRRTSGEPLNAAYYRKHLESRYLN
jgi:carboxypeptidase Taq